MPKLIVNIRIDKSFSVIFFYCLVFDLERNEALKMKKKNNERKSKLFLIVVYLSVDNC